MDMIVIIDGKEEMREVDHVEHERGEMPKHVPALRAGEMLLEPVGGPPIIIRKPSLMEQIATGPTWTTDKPTEPGFYWLDCLRDYPGDLPIMVEVISYGDHYRVSLLAGLSDELMTAEMFNGTQWAAPLVPPEQS